MIELIYCSRVAADLELPEIYRILHSSQAHNTQASITGVLLFNTRYFMQVLEGSVKEVDELYARIVMDRRHTQVQLISRQPLPRRHWAQWSMALVTPGAGNQAVLRKYCLSEEFTPAGLDANNARSLLQELTGSLPSLS